MQGCPLIDIFYIWLVNLGEQINIVIELNCENVNESQYDNCMSYATITKRAMSGKHEIWSMNISFIHITIKTRIWLMVQNLRKDVWRIHHFMCFIDMKFSYIFIDVRTRYGAVILNPEYYRGDWSCALYRTPWSICDLICTCQIRRRYGSGLSLWYTWSTGPGENNDIHIPCRSPLSIHNLIYIQLYISLTNTWKQNDTVSTKIGKCRVHTRNFLTNVFIIEINDHGC